MKYNGLKTNSCFGLTEDIAATRVLLFGVECLPLKAELTFCDIEPSDHDTKYITRTVILSHGFDHTNIDELPLPVKDAVYDQQADDSIDVFDLLPNLMYEERITESVKDESTGSYELITSTIGKRDGSEEHLPIDAPYHFYPSDDMSYCSKRGYDSDGNLKYEYTEDGSKITYKCAEVHHQSTEYGTIREEIVSERITEPSNSDNQYIHQEVKDKETGNLLKVVDLIRDSETEIMSKTTTYKYDADETLMEKNIEYVHYDELGAVDESVVDTQTNAFINEYNIDPLLYSIYHMEKTQDKITGQLIVNEFKNDNNGKYIERVSWNSLDTWTTLKQSEYTDELISQTSALFYHQFDSDNLNQYDQFKDYSNINFRIRRWSISDTNPDNFTIIDTAFIEAINLEKCNIICIREKCYIKTHIFIKDKMSLKELQDIQAIAELLESNCSKYNIYCYNGYKDILTQIDRGIFYKGSVVETSQIYQDPIKYDVRDVGYTVVNAVHYDSNKFDSTELTYIDYYVQMQSLQYKYKNLEGTVDIEVAPTGGVMRAAAMFIMSKLVKYICDGEEGSLGNLSEWIGY